MNELFKIIDFWSLGLIYIRFLDGWKYRIEARALRRAGLARGRSRKFINYAWLADAYTIAYILKHKIDWYLIACFVVALIFMTEYWYTLYLNYPYRMRGCPNFKRPGIWTYFINSILPNKLRRRL